MDATSPRPPHRPTKKTPARVRRLLSATRAGNTRKAAAAYAGISDQTLLNWLHSDLALLAAFTRAEADAERALVGFIRNAAKDDWRAAAHLLACRWPDDWSQKAKLDIDIRTRAVELAETYGLDPQAVLAEAMRWIDKS